MYKKTYKARLIFISAAFITFLSFLFIRLIYVQLIQHSKMAKAAWGQHNVTIELAPKRGPILDRNFKLLTSSLKVDSVYAVAKDVKDKRARRKIIKL